MRYFRSLEPLYLLPPVMLAVSQLPMPYSYFLLMRLLIFLSCAVIAFAAFRSGRRIEAVVVALLGLLYNPVATLQFPGDNRMDWVILNGIMVPVFGVVWYLAQRRLRAGSVQSGSDQP